MKIENFIGHEGDTITITKSTDIYPLLDWAHSKLIELEENEKRAANKDKYREAYQFIGKLMDLAECEGFGNYDDVDEIEY